MKSRRGRLAAKGVVLLLGLGLFAWCVARTDVAAVGQLLARLGWLAPLMLAPYLIVYVVDCLAWRRTLPDNIPLSFIRLFRIRWAGESVNSFLPSAYVGGEAVKVYLLRQHGVPAHLGTSSAVVSKTAQTLAQLVFILIAAGAFLGLAGHRAGVRAGMISVLAGGLAVVVFLFWMQRRGVFASLLAVARAGRLNPDFLERHRDRWLEVDHAITSFYRQQPRRFFASCGLYLLGWLLDTLEIFLAAQLLGFPMEWTQALAVEAFTGVAKALGMWVPGSLGIQESGILLLGGLAGLPDPFTVAYALLRRAREILFAGVGWIFLHGEDLDLKSLSSKPPAAMPTSALRETSPS